MRFQKRLLLSYVLFLIISVVAVCTVSFRASWKQYRTEEYSYLKTMTGKMKQQFEMEYNSMLEVTESLLSDSAILDNLKILSSVQKGTNYRMNAEKKIDVRMDTYHIVKNYYRVLIYTGQEDIFASYDFDERKVCTEIPDSQKLWMERATGRKGRPVLIPPHEDPWSSGERPNVYGIIREILGYDSYLEVEQKEESLNQIFTIYDENVRVMAFFETDGILYGDGKARDITFYQKLCANQLNDDMLQVRNPFTGKQEIISFAYSEMTGVTFLLVEEKEIILQKMAGLLWTTVLILILVIGFFVLFLYNASRKMARPVNELRRQMEQTSLENMDYELHIENSIDEIQALAQTYEQLIRRLRESLNNEKNLTNLQLQARYDLLQAQINPHFFHNVLNVISSKGLLLGDESICEICSSLSEMLRYATGNKTRYVQIGQEVEYLNQYLYLMKLRYQHKLEYQICVEEALKRQTVPKIVFQQIVENSIQHGFNGSMEVMRIEVKGYLDTTGRRWIMEFRDNGAGIEQETINRLQEGMEKMKQQMMNHHELIEMEIGGMGLINTYGRLLLFFGDQVKFTIQGSAEGTIVRITADVSDFSSRR